MEETDSMDEEELATLEDGDEDDESGEEMTPETLATFKKALQEMGREVGSDDESMHSDDFEDIEGEVIDSDDDEDDEMDEAAEEALNQELIKKLLNQPAKRKSEDQKSSEKKIKNNESKSSKVIEVEAKKLVEPLKVIEKAQEQQKKLTKGEKKAAAKAKAESLQTMSPPIKNTQEKVEVKKTIPIEVEQKATSSNIKTLPSGMIVEDVLVGNGPKAKKGKKVSVRYIGKLVNEKLFKFDYDSY